MKTRRYMLCNTLFNKNKFLPAIPPKHDIWYSFHLATSSLTSHLNQDSTLQYPHPSHHPIYPIKVLMHQRQTCHELIHLSLFGHFTLKHLIYLQQLRMNLIQLWCGSWFLGSKNTKLGAAPESGNNEWSSNQRVTTCDNPNSFRLSEWLWILQTFGVCHLYSRSFRLMGNQTPFV